MDCWYPHSYPPHHGKETGFASEAATCAPGQERQTFGANPVVAVGLAAVAGVVGFAVTTAVALYLR